MRAERRRGRLVRRAIEAFGRLDVLVNNAAFQMSRESIEDVPDEEWERTFAINIGSRDRQLHRQPRSEPR